jgi:hypothetical protein
VSLVTACQVPAGLEQKLYTMFTHHLCWDVTSVGMRRFFSACSEPGRSGLGTTPLAVQESEPTELALDAYLIPGADLVLHESIGAGAEGKVSLHSRVTVNFSAA